MQSHLVFSAEKKVSHEFLLASMAIKAVHRMHRPGVRTEDTMGRVFAILAKGNPVEPPPEHPIREDTGQGPKQYTTMRQAEPATESVAAVP